jgi:hypothetical protein
MPMVRSYNSIEITWPTTPVWTLEEIAGLIPEEEMVILKSATVGSE